MDEGGLRDPFDLFRMFNCAQYIPSGELFASYECACATLSLKGLVRTESTHLVPLQVFDDYVGVMQKSSPLLTLLPTPVYWYGLAVGQEFPLCVTNSAAAMLLQPEGASPSGKQQHENEYPLDMKIKLDRVGPAKKGGMRTISFKVGGATQNVEVKDSVAGADFSGPMASADNPLEVR